MSVFDALEHTLRGLGRIKHFGPHERSSRREMCRFSTIASHQVKHGPAFGQQVVRDDSPVTSPPHSFGAHYRTSSRRADCEQFGETGRKLIRQRIIGVVVETLVVPEGVCCFRNIGRAAAQASESSNTLVADLIVGQLRAKHILIELRISSRSRNCTHVDD